MSGCDSRQPHQFVSEGTFDSNFGAFQFIKSRTSLCGRVSKTQLAWGGTRATCQFPFGGVAEKVMHLPCKQAQAGALPVVLHQFQLRGTRLKYRERPHKPFKAGVIPAPAT